MVVMTLRPILIPRNNPVTDRAGAGFCRNGGDGFFAVLHSSHGHPRPNAAGYADRVLFLGDGHIVDEMAEPAAERVLDRMKSFDAAGHAT